ncbi:MAG: hypothetical protein IJ317_04405 [Clostridia bacterium]|nr:hypothetical protein [Clostridia bacterium]
MKRFLFKVSLLFMATLLVPLSLQTAIGGVAEIETNNSPVAEKTVEEATSQEMQGVLRVKRCDLTAVIGEKEFYLPEYSAVSADGTDITHLVEITDSLRCEINKEQGTVVLKEDGVHTITYSVYDEKSKVTLSRSFTVTRYRETFDFTIWWEVNTSTLSIGNRRAYRKTQGREYRGLIWKRLRRIMRKPIFTKRLQPISKRGLPISWRSIAMKEIP